MTGSALTPAGRGQSLIEPARHDHPMRTAIPRPHQAGIAPLSTMPAAVASFFRIVERHAISSIGTNSAIRRAARSADFRFQI
ncbi:hypothetical protein [Burkholderia thailandensis]|uniref:hypothetical protein n=1 Tax=Burkholderia thailandensis TaxID=57975 RepID=UPI00046C9628|nr:hypothetical protein [Burkholderia thailandensis]KVG15487.1 hypothetical protein WJ25_25500 [Burkholderia thailandensis]KVG20660.1 hypothetical protein WJ28_03090 [Burkholderia thailandensis]MBS2131110.1 hypothetical protein [Burkholderia thailandensis]MCS3396321.1 hypothetical protein [Burkholderia thailandensis]MCS6469835.1 hypothetical protein [Burkholderia thailandensis]